MNKGKVVISFSGGKDSILSLYRMIKNGYEVIELLVTFDNQNDSCFHKIPRDILEKVSKELEIPLTVIDCSGNKNYEEEFEKALKVSKDKGAEVCVFGDIDIEAHKKWCLDRCNAAEINGVFPLWQENRESLTNEFIDYGFKAVIKKVNLNALGIEFLGEELTKEVVNEIKKLGCDPSGENGEYHTLVFDGPIFKHGIKFDKVNKEIVGDFGYLTIKI
ncbi:diphthine--ammonia ligase [Clostridium chromiireducens]|uniref:tRNA-specific 2-thiouridylase MnmA n=1 Tax=Clostridium chromiireducens TaxID=225345 RepID=A0A1V4ICW4_9CLOT|nr:diphthine--ammonia ligase [Clostridium chromiireducens]OPJ57842.1 tRNA-specific 2-thiouridylase MnmA [Clostridium chromiireducens]